MGFHWFLNWWIFAMLRLVISIYKSSTRQTDQTDP